MSLYEGEALGLSISESDPDCIRIAPEADVNGRRSSRMATQAGEASADLEKDDRGLRLTVSVPTGLHVQVRLPAYPTDRVYIDGEPLPPDTQITRNERYVELAVLPGSTYVFQVIFL